MEPSQKRPLIFLVSLMLLVAIEGIYLFAQNKPPKTVDITQPTDSMSGWKTYRNLGIEFQYPDSKEWGSPQESIWGENMFQLYFDTSTSTNAFFVAPLTYSSMVSGPLTFDQQITSMTSNRDHTGADPGYIVKDIAVNGLHGKEIEHSYSNSDGTTITSFEAVFPFNDQASISFDGDSTLVSVDTFNKIIGSFKIDESSKAQTDPITGWIVYKNSDITFEYPQKFDTDYASLSLRTLVLNQDDNRIDSGGCYFTYLPSGNKSESQYVTINNIKFCLTEGGDVGAGQSYESYIYTTLRNGYYHVLEYAVHTSNGCGVYKNSSDENAPENERYRECLDFGKNYDALVTLPIQKSIGTFSFTD